MTWLRFLETNCISNFIITTRQRICREVIFSVMSVHHSVHSQGWSMWSLPMMHWTSLYSPTLVLVSDPKFCPHGTSLDRDLPASGIWWPSLETFSNLFTWGLPLHCWHLLAIEAHMVGILLECFLVFIIYWCLCRPSVNGKENIRLCQKWDCFEENNTPLIRSLLCHMHY